MIIPIKSYHFESLVSEKRLPDLVKILLGQGEGDKNRLDLVNGDNRGGTVGTIGSHGDLIADINLLHSRAAGNRSGDLRPVQLRLLHLCIGLVGLHRCLQLSH